MANRSYLYSLGNRPTSYGDRPETISGLSEWPYGVPFLYRLLMSGDPQLCASLISDGLAGEGPGQRTPLYAVSSVFAAGFERVERFAALVRRMAVEGPAPESPLAPPSQPKASLMGRLGRLLAAPPVPCSAAAAPESAHAPAQYLPAWIDEMLLFLHERRDSHLLLETIELDIATVASGCALRACVEAEAARCRHAGAAFDALPADPAAAMRVLHLASAQRQPPPLDAFHGLHFNDDCDSSRRGAAERPLGFTGWSDVLYFDLLGRARFEAQRSPA